MSISLFLCTRPVRLAGTVLLCWLAAGQIAGAQPAEWTVNPASFQSSMTMTSALFLDGRRATGQNDVVAAFVGDEVRGVASPVPVSGALVYFMTVYANSDGESISFKVYVAESGQVLDIGESLTFTANATHGTLASPFAWNAAGAATCPVGQPDWTVNPAAFESTMSVTAAVFVDGLRSSDDGDLLAALAGEEVRGVAPPTMLSGQHVFFLTVYANGGGEKIRFQYYDAAANLVRAVGETTTFVANAILGAPGTPFSMTGSCVFATGVEDVSEGPSAPMLVGAYPNPFQETTVLEYVLPEPGHVVVEVFDLLGRVVRILVDRPLPSGHHTAVLEAGDLPPGVYLYRVRTGSQIRTGHVVLAR